MTSLELVVARYAEDLSWLRRVPKTVRVTVYNKGGDTVPGMALPNVGREAHTYLHHMVTRYDDLAEVTLFCQGKPFDHVPDLHKILRQLAAGMGSGGTASGRPNRTRGARPSCGPVAMLHPGWEEDGFHWLGFVIDRDDRTGSLLFQNWTKNPERHPLFMDLFWKELWSEDVPETFVFYPGGNFAVTRERITSRPRAFYEKALRVSAYRPDAAHCFERTWDHVFGVNGIPEAYRSSPLPVYFKPIKRLA